MSDHSNVSEFPLDAQAVPPRPAAETRPLYWSVRRELWENRSLTMAPLIVAAVFLFGAALSTITLPYRMLNFGTLDPAVQHDKLVMPFAMLGGVMAMTSFVVGAFYCLDALYGERRDRSILFWKSLPVSDRDTILSKAAIPLAVLPLFVYVIAVAAQVILLILSTFVLMGNRVSPFAFWMRVSLFRLDLALLYGIAAMVLWHAPVYAWLLLLSGWAKRAVALWVILPPLLIGMFEQMAFRTHSFMKFIGYRMTGWFFSGFRLDNKDTDPLSSLTPGRYLAQPGLWFGLVLAAIFLAAAIRLRRNREPI